tara:strand:- start:74 stop:352 length:279 start_codon:yes stop_codon:yes gene_type:complete
MKNESIKNCIKKENSEKLSIDLSVSSFITEVKYRYSHFSINLHAYHYFYKSGDILCNIADDWNWINIQQLYEFPFPKANHYIFPDLLNQEVA